MNTKGVIFSTKFEQRVVFFFVAVGVITVTLGVFKLFDFLPEKPNAESVEVMTSEESETISMRETSVETLSDVAPLPVSIIFDSLEREVKVLNPESNTVEALDTALLSGVVRHPDSADFANEGTMFLLGHSSYLPNVQNRNFQAFNGIQKLEWGDIIRVRSADMEYVYSVDKVYEAKASSAEVPLQFDVPKLVLATCNSYGTKDDRYIVEASLIMKRAIAQ